MAGRAYGIGTHGQRPAEKAGNRGASNYCFGWFHLFTLLFVWLISGRLRGCVVLGEHISKMQKRYLFIPYSRTSFTGPTNPSFTEADPPISPCPPR
jgi:hypothetical protein